MDAEHVAALLAAAKTPATLTQAQATAAKALKAAGEPPYPKNGCAATLSALLQIAGIAVPMTLGAGRLANILGGQLKSRGWAHVPVGEQKAGDVGVTFDEGGNAGADHIYLVIEPIDDDVMLIADNQAKTLHKRAASGTPNKTPTEYFLRATPTTA
jgi:hypothetical protein